MGKASRKKRAPGGDRAERDIDRWLNRAGITRLSNEAFWNRAEAIEGDWAARWEGVDQEDATPVAYETLASMRLVESRIRGHQHLAWLSWLRKQIEGLDGPQLIIDLGCGPGIHTCWLASQFPSADVIGVDPSPHARSAAAALAEDLHLANVRITDDVAGQRADLLVASLVTHEIDPDLVAGSPPNPFSDLESAEMILRGARRSPAAEAIASALAPEGRALMLVRSPDFSSHVRWASALSAADLRLVGEDQLTTRVLDLNENLSAQVVEHSETEWAPSVEDMTLVWTARGSLADELRLQRTGATELVWAVSLRYMSGGTERLEIRSRPDGAAFVAWKTTDRGYREFVDEAPDAAAVDQWRSQMLQYAEDRRSALASVHEEPTEGTVPSLNISTGTARR